MHEWKEDGKWILTDERGNTLTVPLGSMGGQVHLNDEIIPSGSLWSMLIDASIKQEKLDRQVIMDEALRAQIYIQRSYSSLLMTSVPPKDGVLVHGNVYMVTNHQRIRPLFDHFGLMMGKIKAMNVGGSMVKDMMDAAETLGIYPVGGQDNRYYFSKDPDRVFNELGTRDWVRIGVMMKRAGSSSVPLDLHCE